MKLTKRVIISIIVVASTLILLKLCVSVFSPGNIPYGKEYNIHANEKHLIEVIHSFKIEHQEYIVPIRYLKDTFSSRSNVSKYFDAYIYSKRYDVIFYFWFVQGDDITETTLKFVGTIEKNKGVKYLNKDFSKSQSEFLIREFEENFLSKLGLKYEKVNNWIW